jgi:hypothetical protein
VSTLRRIAFVYMLISGVTVVRTLDAGIEIERRDMRASPGS